MKRILIVIYSLISILITNSCEKERDILFSIKVIDTNDSTAIKNIDVSVKKRKSKLIYGFKIVDSYSGKTDSTGVCKLLIDDYANEKYEYSIDINMYDNNPPDYGGYTYSQWGTVLQEMELDELLIVKLRKIPFRKNTISK
ncbi:MAG: hypothetical protein V1781_04360 [Bacteroidota bacterium]